jgi:hypothetical protein
VLGHHNQQLAACWLLGSLWLTNVRCTNLHTCRACLALHRGTIVACVCCAYGSGVYGPFVLLQQTLRHNSGSSTWTWQLLACDRGAHVVSGVRGCTVVLFTLFTRGRRGCTRARVSDFQLFSHDLRHTTYVTTRKQPVTRLRMQVISQIEPVGNGGQLQTAANDLHPSKEPPANLSKAALFALYSTSHQHNASGCGSLEVSAAAAAAPAYPDPTATRRCGQKNRRSA